MIDLDCIVKSLRLAWLRQIFNIIDGTWKRYLQCQLKPLGGFFSCSYNISDCICTIQCQFCCDFLLRWSEFRETLASIDDWKIIISIKK